MKKNLLLGILALVFSVKTMAQDKKTAEACMQKADYVCAEEQYGKLAQAEQIQKYKSEYLLNLGLAQRRSGKIPAAFKSFESAMIANPLSPKVFAQLGILHQQKGSKTKALEYLDKGIALDDKNSEMYLTRAKVYESLGKKDLAEKDLKQVLTFDTNNILAKSGLANFKKRNGDLNGSLKDFNQMISEKPESLLYNGRAELFLKMNRPKEALADITKSLTLDAKFAQTHYIKAQILQATGNTKEMCASLNKAIALGFEKALVKEQLGKCSQ